MQRAGEFRRGLSLWQGSKRTGFEEFDAVELAALQKNFDVTALGSGDPIVGFNLLATMACTLAHLAPDDGAVVHPDGSPARLGTSLLVLGSASAGRVVDEVITEVSRMQNNLTTHQKVRGSSPFGCIFYTPFNINGLASEKEAQIDTPTLS
jgi:hypothetical protein